MADGAGCFQIADDSVSAQRRDEERTAQLLYSALLKTHGRLWSLGADATTGP